MSLKDALSMQIKLLTALGQVMVSDTGKPQSGGVAGGTRNQMQFTWILL